MLSTIGQTIKKLRKERNLTQEELAQQLNVTSKAVSKWENETGMPDISQVVPLASVFGVSADVLFGIFGTSDDEEVQKFIDKIEKEDRIDGLWDENGNWDEQKEIVLRTRRYESIMGMQKQYPNNIKLLSYFLGETEILAREYKHVGDNRANEIFKEFLREANLIINYGKDMRVVMDAHRWLVWGYSDFGDYEKATEHANMFPEGFDMNRGTMLAWIDRAYKNTDGELKQRCHNIESLLDTFKDEISSLGTAYYKKGQYDDAIRVYKSIFGIITAIYGEEEYTPPLHILAWLHGNIADCYLKLGDIENAYSWFEKMIEHHKTNGKYYNRRTQLKTPLLRECKFEFYAKEYNAKSFITNDLNLPKFDGIRNTERFKSLLEQISNLEDQ